MGQHDQQQIRFDPRPNRPNNWFLSDFLRALEQARLAESLKRVGPNVCWLLTAIATREHALRYQQTPHFAERQLVELTGIAKTTLRVAIEKAEQAGWLVKVPTGNSGAWFRVQIPAGLEPAAPVAELVRFAEPSGPDQSRTGPEPDRNRTATGPEPDQNRTNLYPNPSPCPSPPPPLSPEGGAGGRAGESELEELAKALSRLGVRLAPSTVRRALSQGRTVDEIRARIRHYEERPGAWGAGALCFVLTCPDYAGAPIDDWPPPDAAWVQSQARVAADQQQRETAARLQQQQVDVEARRQREREEMKQLELDFGDEVDRMNRDDQFQLLPESHRFMFRALVTKGEDPAKSPMLRPALLRAFAARAGDN